MKNFLGIALFALASLGSISATNKSGFEVNAKSTDLVADYCIYYGGQYYSHLIDQGYTPQAANIAANRYVRSCMDALGGSRTVKKPTKVTNHISPTH